MEEGTRLLEMVGRIEKLEKQQAQSEQKMRAMAKEMANLREIMIEDDSESESDSDGCETVNSKEQNNQPQQNNTNNNRPMVTVAEAAAKIVPHHLESFLATMTVKGSSYGSDESIQLLEFADYFGLAFSEVGAPQFPWVHLFKDATLAEIIEIPLSNVSYAVYRISVDWINQRSLDALSSFILGLLHTILADLADQFASIEASKKGAQPSSSSKSQVAVFAVLAMVLRGKPEALLHVLPILRDNFKYQGEDKVLVMVCQGDLSVGLYGWAHNLLPLLSFYFFGPNNSRDLILQLVERILSVPKARAILMGNAIQEGLIPPSSFEILIRLTYPLSYRRVNTIKETPRFKALYPTLKQITLAGVTGSKEMEHVSQQIFNIAIQTAREGIGTSDRAKEGKKILLWSLSQHSDCYKLWDKLYLDNLEVTVVALREMSEQWDRLNLSQSAQKALKATLKSFREKNKKALDNEDTPQQALCKNAEKYCELLARRVSGCDWIYYVNLCQIIIGFVGIVAAAISEYFDIRI